MIPELFLQHQNTLLKKIHNFNKNCMLNQKFYMGISLSTEVLEY